MLWVYGCVRNRLLAYCLLPTKYLAYFLSNFIGCSGQTVLNLKNLFDVFYQAWPDDHVCQDSRWLDKICDRRCILKVFDINQDGGKSIMAWTKASNDPLFVNIGRMGRKLWTWMHVQLWPDGGARADELATSNLLDGLMGLSWSSVPNSYHPSQLFTKAFYGLPLTPMEVK